MKIIENAIYRGIKNCQSVSKEFVLTPENRSFVFEINEKDEFFGISDKTLLTENLLYHGEKYDLETENHIIFSVKPKSEERFIIPEIHGNPGVLTIKNLLKTASEPLGKTLYVFGGGWNFQDDGGSLFSKRTKIPEKWEKFFFENDENYEYRNDENKKNSTYPYGGFNSYFYAGLDCSGFIGKTVFDTLYPVYKEDDGFVGYAKSTAKRLSEKHKFGTFSRSENKIFSPDDVFPGDIISTDGHVFMIFGKFSDKSIAIIHSSPEESFSKKFGGGVQFSVLFDGKNPENTLAYKTVKKVNETHFSDWAKRYPVSIKSYKEYMTVSENKDTGKFSWTILSDPDGYKNISAEKIFYDIFGI